MKKRGILAAFLAVVLLFELMSGNMRMWENVVLAAGTEHEAYDAAPYITAMFDFRLRPVGGSVSDEAQAYCFNFHKEAPPSSETVFPYTWVQNATNQQFLEKTENKAKVREPDRLKQNVIDLIWNGYPYYGGNWKPADESIKGEYYSDIHAYLVRRYGYAGGIPSAERQGLAQLTPRLCDIYATQNAIWYYTDGISIGEGSHYVPERVNDLISEAKRNPAPHNFTIDLYDGTAIDHGWFGKPYQNLLVVRKDIEAPARTVKIQINKEWKNANGSSYTSKTPYVKFELYEGEIEEGESPVAVKELPIHQTTGTDTVVFELLDDDQKYTVREVMTGREQEFVADAETETVNLSDPGEEFPLTFTNTYNPPGEIELSKKLSSQEGVPVNAAFQFAVTLTKDGKSDTQTYTLIGEETRRITGIEAGTAFTIKEIGAEDYTLEGITVNGESVDNINGGATGTVDGKDVEQVVFTNKYTPKGSFTLYKKVVGTDPPEGTTFDFQVVLTDSQGDPYTGTYTQDGMVYSNRDEFTLKLGSGKTTAIGGLPVGTRYGVTENDSEDYQLTDVRADDASVSVTETGAAGTVKNGNVNILFENTPYNTTELSVEKVVLDGDMDLEHKEAFPFKVELFHSDGTTSYDGTYELDGGTVTTYDPNTGIVFTLQDAQKKIIGGLEEGTKYKVTEQLTDDQKKLYQSRYESYTGTLNGSRQVWAVNDYIETFSLSLQKQLTGGGQAFAYGEQFTFRVEFTGETLDDIDIISTSPGSCTDNGDGSYTVKLAGEETVTFTGLPAGYQYKIAEEGDAPVPVSSVAIAVDGKDSKNAWISERTVSSKSRLAENTAIVFTNEIEPINELAVYKQVEGAGDLQREWKFRVELSDKSFKGDFPGHDGMKGMSFENGVAVVALKHDERAIATGIPAGMGYKVTEESAQGYVTYTRNAEGVIVENTSVQSIFTNYKEPEGQLKVRKTAVNGPSGGVWTFGVQLDRALNGTYGGMQFKDGQAVFKLKSGEEVEATGIPAGISYRVWEEEADQDGYVTLSSGETGEIADGQTAEAVFTNHYVPDGSFLLTKKVAGNHIDPGVRFRFCVELTAADGAPYNGNYTVNGSQKEYAGEPFYLELKADEIALVAGFPKGTAYKITEEKTEGFELSAILYNGQNVTAGGCAQGITADGKNDMIEFQNMKEESEINLTVKKIVTKAPGQMAHPDFSFKVELKTNGEPYSGTYILDQGAERTYDPDRGITLSITDQETAVIGGLPAGTEYVVREELTREQKAVYNAQTDAVKGVLEESRWENFINEYHSAPVKEDKPKGTVPHTGDDMQMAVPAAAAVFSMIIIGSISVYRIRKRMRR